PDRLEPLLQVPAAEAGIDEHRDAFGFDDRRVAFAAAAEHADDHVAPPRAIPHAADSTPRMPAVSCTFLLDIAVSAVERKRSRSYGPRALPAPQLKGGTYFGGCVAPKMLDPAPTTVPVFSMTPMPVFTW